MNEPYNTDGFLLIKYGFSCSHVHAHVHHFLQGNKLIVEPRGVHNVMQMDDNEFSSHPVYVQVDNPDEINRIFDLISYAKVGSLEVLKYTHIPSYYPNDNFFIFFY